ncbi:ATR-interacting protein isoform X2 [Hippocampus comes]|uniref:ATR-interacting protein isoform X2 n=1 Tax=Hippocampus comes TaxID=109280 RepID=UPI00094E4D4B|nr:PREDICTED: ATR-interacting protein isoform X2 [Hippocampus comes]
MAFPPCKRLRGLNQDVPKADPVEVDPFGDDDDFTQDDLDEIDIIASQAIGLATAPVFGSKEASKAVFEQAHGSGFQPSTRENKGGLGGKRGHLGAPDKEPTGRSGNRPWQIGAHQEDSYILLEAQHADLRRKLKEVEEEIVSKNGEIRVLRDSLRGAQKEKETQRQALALLERQKQREQSDKEKELNKKVQSLQSELQFKEAEINEMKSKLLSADRSKPASPLPRNSSKVPNGLSLQRGSSGSSSAAGSGFITKETFASPLKTPGKTHRDGVDKQEVAWPDPFQCSRPPHQLHRGGVLLGLLLQQPLSPSSLCLSHLLSISPSDVCLTAKPNSAAAKRHLRPAGAGRNQSRAPQAPLSPIQSLAITGLNMLSQSQPAAADAEHQHGCPGAVLLLPLLDMHLSHLCQALDARGEASGSAPERRTATTAPGRPEEVDAVSLEDAGLAALRILYMLINHSDEVVQAVLSTQSEGGTENQVLGHRKGKTDVAIAMEALRSHCALLQFVLRLCHASRGEGRLEEMVVGAVKVASILIERTPNAHADRLQCVLKALHACALAHRKPRVLAECTAAMVRACDHASLTRQLCSHHEPCVILRLLQHVRKRPVKKASHGELIRLELQVVRLLNRLSQTAESWQSSSCQCDIEVVQTSVIILHRQWLDLYNSPEPTDRSPGVGPSRAQSDWWREPPASLLRECVLLLHRLLHHHAGFSASCRPLLHMYDQAISALRDIFRKIPDLSESEELAFEEICRQESDDTDDMDTESGS